MEAQILTPIPVSKKYGITEKKKSEIDSLTNQVIDVTAEIQQQQVILTSLNEKSQKYQGYLVTAENNRVHALNNKNLIDQVIQNAHDLAYNSKNAFSTMAEASEASILVSTDISELINKLIYAVEILNKLSNLVTRKKALNPLISDDLVSKLASAGSDANNAIALTLIALKATLAAETSVLEAEATVTLEADQAGKLYLSLTNERNIDEPLSAYPLLNSSIRGLLYQAYDDSKVAYEKAKVANDQTSRQLNIANTNLSKAQIKLKSLQAGLAAANAAALAS